MIGGGPAGHPEVLAGPPDIRDFYEVLELKMVKLPEGASKIWRFFVIGGQDSGQCGTFHFVSCLADTGHMKCSKSNSIVF